MLVFLAPLRCFRSAKVRGWLQFIMDVDIRGQRLDLVIDRGQLLVFGGDELHRLLGDVRIGGETAATGSPTKRTFSWARIG